MEEERAEVAWRKRRGLRWPGGLVEEERPEVAWWKRIGLKWPGRRG